MKYRRRFFAVFTSTDILYKYQELCKNVRTKGHSKFINNNGPWKSLYYEAFMNKDDAVREEIFLKSGIGRERMKYLFKY